MEIETQIDKGSRDPSYNPAVLFVSLLQVMTVIISLYRVRQGSMTRLRELAPAAIGGLTQPTMNRHFAENYLEGVLLMQERLLPHV